MKKLLLAFFVVLLASHAHAQSTTLYSDGATGNVGIGTSAPGALLDVGSSGTTSGTIRTEGSTSGYVEIQPAAAAGSWTMTLPSSPGTSGDVLQTDGSGVTSWVAPSGGGGISWQSVQASNFTAAAGNGYPVNTTSAAITVTLPASPSAGNQVGIVDYAGTFSTHNFTINPNGLKINGSSSNRVIGVNNYGITLTYIDATQGWVVTSQVAGNPFPASYSANYLIVGGGGGAVVGGGGAGGFLTGSQSITAGTVYTVIVGSGGAPEVNGGNSSVLGLTAIGGGSGGFNATYPAGSGGSGGGAGNNFSGSYSGGSGTTGQGYAGGSVNTASAGAGGGGASAAGVNGSGGSSGTGGNGGAGLSSSITGTSVTYAGGGGGGCYTGTPGIGGAGGGGNGSRTTGSAGTANTGGGGGGGYGSSGGAGGSGVVILSVPTANYSGITTGSPTVTSSGTNTIIKFTTSGSYTG